MKSKIKILNDNPTSRQYKGNKYSVDQKTSYVWNKQFHKKQYRYGWNYMPASSFNLSIQDGVRYKYIPIEFCMAYDRNTRFSVLKYQYSRPTEYYFLTNSVIDGRSYNAKYLIDETKRAPFYTKKVENSLDTLFFGGFKYATPNTSFSTEDTGCKLVILYADLDNKFLTDAMKAQMRFAGYRDQATGYMKGTTTDYSKNWYDLTDYKRDLDKILRSSQYIEYMKTVVPGYVDRINNNTLSGYGNELWSFHGYSIGDHDFFTDKSMKMLIGPTKYSYHVAYEANYSPNDAIAYAYAYSKKTTWDTSKPFSFIVANGSKEPMFTYKQRYAKTTDINQISPGYTTSGYTNDYRNISERLDSYRRSRKIKNYDYDNMNFSGGYEAIIMPDSDYGIDDGDNHDGNNYNDGYSPNMPGRGSPMIVPVIRIEIPCELECETQAGFESNEAVNYLYNIKVYKNDFKGLMTIEEAIENGYKGGVQSVMNVRDESVPPEYFSSRVEVEYEDTDEGKYEKVGSPVHNVGLYPYFDVGIPNYKQYDILTNEYIGEVNVPTVAKIPVLDPFIASLPSGTATGDLEKDAAFYEAADKYNPTTGVDESNPNIVNRATSYRIYKFKEFVQSTITDYYPDHDYYYQKIYGTTIADYNASRKTISITGDGRDGYWYYESFGQEEYVAAVTDLGNVKSLVQNAYPSGGYGPDGFYYKLIATKIDNFSPIKRGYETVTSTRAFAFPNNGIQLSGNTLYGYELVSNKKYIDASSISATGDEKTLIGNVQYNKSINSDSGLPFGDVATSSINFRVNKNYATVSNYLNRLVTYEVAFTNTDKFQRVGVFKITEIKATSEHTCEITAYDLNTLFDKEAQNILDKIQYPVSVRMLIEIICEYCEVDYLHRTFFNDEMLIEAPILKDKYTFKDVLKWIAEIVPAVISFNSSGELVVKQIAFNGTAGGSTSTTATFMSIEPNPTIVPTCIIYKDQAFGNMEVDSTDEYGDLSDNMLIDPDNLGAGVANTQNQVFTMHNYTLMKQEAKLPTLSTNVDIGDFWVNSTNITGTRSINNGLGIITSIKYDDSGITINTGGIERPNIQTKKDLNDAQIMDKIHNYEAQFKALVIDKVVFYLDDNFTTYKTFDVDDVMLSVDSATISGINGDLVQKEDGSYLNEVIIDATNAIMKFFNGENNGFVQLFNSGVYYGNQGYDPRLTSGGAYATMKNSNELGIRTTGGNS